MNMGTHATSNSSEKLQKETSSEQLSTKEWRKLVADYQVPHVGRAVWQLVNTLVPILAIWIGVYFLKDVSLLLCIPFAMLGGLFLVRAFIIFHDCGHGSFFKSKKANSVVGFLTGMLTFTPYRQWSWEHARHHATNGDLDRRGIGDIWTLTVEEYLTSSKRIKFSYRFIRNPIILFLIAPLFLFIVLQRVSNSKAKAREKRSVYVMNGTLVLWCIGMSTIYGFVPWLIIQLSMMSVASGFGLWLFYVQHQFEDTYWAQGKDWDYTAAAMEGSSYYNLPRILQWFSGNIGFHHIHHLNPLIPNYNLERCHYSNPFFQQAPELRFFNSFKTIKLRLWDEVNGKMISFRELKRQLATRPTIQPSA
jgi:omega-6 fatty acid desaturase (delta-12 desaturase)